MLTVFIEYKLQPEKREQALRLLASMASRLAAWGASEYRSYEGLDQPGLFVETFDVSTVHEYEQIKEHRLADQEFCDCITGGAAKLHVWAFRPADYPK